MSHSVLGIKAFVDIGFGLAGSLLVDRIGVRRVSLIALGVAIFGRTLLAFGRTMATLYAALFVLSPCGDALLSVGLYRVALKKLTTPKTRPLAFGFSYAVSNLAGACVALVVDWMRRSFKDVRVCLLDTNEGDGDGNGSSSSYYHVMLRYANDLVGGVYTPVRQFIVSGIRAERVAIRPKYLL